MGRLKGNVQVFSFRVVVCVCSVGGGKASLVGICCQLQMAYSDK